MYIQSVILKLEIILFEQGSGQFYYFPFEPFRYILLIAYQGKNLWRFCRWDVSVHMCNVE
jgi:hypothetical protein